MHQRAAIFRRHQNRLGRRQPFRKILLSFGQLHDVAGSVLESDELAGQGNRILETAGPINHEVATTG